MTQLQLPRLPVADEDLRRAFEHERFLQDVMMAVVQTEHWDGYAPSTRSIAEQLLCSGEDAAALDGPEFARTREALEELEGRGLIVGTVGDPGYFGRDDEETITRWNARRGPRT
jgi:hypothetical protein